MNRRRTIVLTALVAIAALGVLAFTLGPLVYRDLIAAKPDAVPTVSAPGPAPTGASETPGRTADDLTGDWIVGEGSFAGYRVNEVLNGVDVTVTGRTAEVQGRFVVDGLTLTEGEITVNVASIATDNASRDDYFRRNALRTDEHPTATFRLTEPLTAAEAPREGVVQRVTAQGELTLAGQTRAVTVEVEAVLSGDGGQVAGRVPIVFQDFGVTAPSLGFVSVEPEGFVEFQLALVRE